MGRGTNGAFVGLGFKFGVLFVGVTVALSVFNVAWNWRVQNEQARERMLETAQVLARQCDAVWEFMEINQQKFVRKDDGTYDMYCVVAAKSVTRLFSNDGDYSIHYTNTTTRKEHDAPDDFERETIESMRLDATPQSYFILTEDPSGEAVFRYLEPIYITESCLECHGSPAGEPDMMGYPKEGMAVGDVAGAVSIAMPAQAYLDDVLANTVRESATSLATTAAGLLVIFYALSRLVTRPLRKMEDAAEKVGSHDFAVDLAGVGDRDELERLAKRFEGMASELEGLYGGLESRVEERTEQLMEANRELERMNGRLAEESRYKGDFLATMSHEIRTPLTSILAFADIYSAGRQAQTPEEARALESLRYNSRLLLEMVNNVLNMARAQAGRTELSLEPFDPAEFVAYMRESMDFIARRRGVALRFESQRGMPVVTADSEKLKHILENLVTNAVKFSAEGGEVAVRLSYDEGSQTLSMEVEDHGCGIAPEDLETIFERFSKASRSLSSHSVGGSGLGLAVAREFAEEHGGSVRVASEVGTGSMFVATVRAEKLGGSRAEEDA